MHRHIHRERERERTWSSGKKKNLLDRRKKRRGREVYLIGGDWEGHCWGTKIKGSSRPAGGPQGSPGPE